MCWEPAGGPMIDAPGSLQDNATSLQRVEGIARGGAVF
jgi:hypothetical protein